MKRETPSREELQKALLSRCSQEDAAKLAKAKVAVAGLGGLGSNVALFLARAGVGHLQLIDFDKVDITNLNRQHYFIPHLGRYKTEALKEQLLDINPWLDIRTSCEKVTEENIPRLFQSADIICEAFDRPENKAMLVNGCLEEFPDKPLVCASGMAGWGKSNAIATRKVGRNFYICGDETSGIEEGEGLVAPRVALCAAHEANLILELLLGGRGDSSR
ncbi:MAG TPA: sulfur carrier protein ThiS adenylyltransferase ThiF [Candidatus Blautia merdigallinarum]|uniref:Sulfur carrier protein ThiS adenylyltransferase ThiF n=1 Tax=Candidatus Blautia merdigallinarum TaxID=2838495 RepID=A0A9D2N6M0_9FIRM|nr:sulfur carrier protein ThiS adenylyltransferase ThiF [Candidatus Blautia merdigallinarum]